MSDINVQLTLVRERLAQLDPNNRDHLYEINELNAKVAELSRQLKAEEAEAELQRQHEERVQASVVTLQNVLDTASIEGFAIRDLCLDEARYQLLSIWVQGQFAAQAEEFSKQIQQEVAENKRLRDELADTQDLVEAKDAEISTLRSQNYQLSIENQQLSDYRDNAGNIIEEKEAEIERLESQVDDLRKEIAVGARNAYKVTNLDGAKELADKIRASLVPVTNIEQINSNTIRLTHPDGTQTEDNWLNKGKYRVMGGEEATRFLEEQAKLSANVQEVAATEPVTFPEIAPPKVDLHGIHEDTAQGDSGEAREDAEALGAKSLEERVAALEKAVFRGAA